MANACVHYFVIEPPVPDKRQLLGTCQRCGATKMHDAYIEDGANWYTNKRFPLNKRHPDDWQYQPEENYDIKRDDFYS